jgi:Zn-dependent peptidase ImmA (M78 family)/transcriptional regulator with XRE-family HTH domain
MRRGTYGFVASQMKDARLARQLTGSKLAEKLGVSRQVISDYEAGKKTPSPELLIKISQSLDVPIEFFLNQGGFDDTTESSSPVFYRSMSSATKRARISAQTKYKWLRRISLTCADYVELPPVNFPSFKIPKDPVEISSQEIEELAIKVRRFWGLGDGPISNVVWLLENNGVIISRYSLAAAELDAFSQWVNGRPFIMLGADKCSAVRSRFDAAHELGHLIMHRHLTQSAINDCVIFKLIEEQAHRFASAFLFPQKSFADEVFLLSNGLQLLVTLKQRWKLSIAMMIKRAANLELITRTEEQTLWKQYLQRNWKKREPLDNELPIEKPRLLKNAIELLVEEKVATSSDIVSWVNLHPSETEDLTGLVPNYLSQEVPPVIRLRLATEMPTELSSVGNMPKHYADIIQFPQRNPEPIS